MGYEASRRADHATDLDHPADETMATCAHPLARALRPGAMMWIARDTRAPPRSRSSSTARALDRTLGHRAHGVSQCHLEPSPSVR